MTRPLSKPLRRRKEVLRTSTIREFGGGLNIIDSDLNLDTKFAKELTNMVRGEDGSQKIRQGTKFFVDTSVDPGSRLLALATDALTTGGIGTSVVTVAHAAHGLVTGNEATIAGTTTWDGVATGDINKKHTITVVDANNYTVNVSPSTATVGTTAGGGAAITATQELSARTITGVAINFTFFQNLLILVDATGKVAKVDTAGKVNVIFDTLVAGELPGAPAGWSATAFVSFAIFGGRLIICNGIDKPLLVNTASIPNPVTFLQDIPAASNANTPVARYVASHDHFVVMAGDPTDPALVHISHQDASGTWLGDGAPNNAITVDVSKVAQPSVPTIRSIHNFRDKVLVGFDDVSVIGDLNIFAAAVHTPDFDDNIEGHGTISHRSVQSLGNDLLMMDNIGVPSVAQALFTGVLRPDRLSQLVDPDIQSRLDGLSIGTTEDRVWSVFNRRDGQYMLFIPNNDVEGSTTETFCYVYTTIPALKIKAWSLFRGWNFRCGASSPLGRVFFADGTKIYQLGTTDDPVLGDFVNDPDVADPTNGTAISFVWEFPWADFDERIHIKKAKYLALDTTGKANFTVQMFVDNVFRDDAGALLTPELTLAFTGGNTPGYGGGGESQQGYGGGRRTRDPRFWAWRSKFQIAKFRVTGADTQALKIVSVSMAYTAGSVRR